MMKQTIERDIHVAQYWAYVDPAAATLAQHSPILSRMTTVDSQFETKYL